MIGLKTKHADCRITFKVCLLPSDNFFSQIFCNCLHLDEIFSCHNGAMGLSQNVQQKKNENRLTNKKSSGQTVLNRDFVYKNLMKGR